jgi:DNA-directed RNA polymerase beta' subunit
MVDNGVKEISKISFGVYSSEEIKSMSVAEITSSRYSLDENLYDTVYDPRLGSIKTGVICEICRLDAYLCPGHMGYIEFAKPVINPMFLSHVLIMLKLFCNKCCRFLLDEERMDFRGFLKIKSKKRFLLLCEHFKKNCICIHCYSVQPEYKLDYKEGIQSIIEVYECSETTQQFPISVEECLKRFQNITDEDVRLIGLNPTLVHPKNFIFTNFPVIPTSCRPHMISDGNVCDDDLTYQLVEILKNNIFLKNESPGLKKKNIKLDVTKCYNNLLFRIQTYFNNSQKKAKHATTGRPIKGIKERIAGKEGQIRNNLLGKRTNQSARTVIGPDPQIDILTIVIPEIMSNILTIPELVYQRNYEEISLLLKNDKVNYIIKPDSRKINVQIKNKFIFKHGDEILFDNGNRKIIYNTDMHFKDKFKILRNGKIFEPEIVEIPSLEIGDVVHRKLRDGDFVMLNRQPTLHKASMMAFKIKILPVKTIMLNPAVTKPFNCDFDGDEMNIHVPQSIEAKTELIELSTPAHCLINTQAGKPNICIVQDSLTAAYILTNKANEPLSKSQYYRIISRVFDSNKRLENRPVFKNVIDYVLPQNLSVSFEDLKIEKGKIIFGVLNKKYLGSSNYSLIKIINYKLGLQTCIKFINEIQLVCNDFLLLYGFTINAEDCLTTQNIDGMIDKFFLEAESHKLDIKHLKIRESKIINCLSKARDLGLYLASQALKPENNFITTVKSGSKGDFFNIAQITGLLGQQTLTNGRIQGMLNNGKRTLPHFPMENLSLEDEYKSRGFICNSFEKGLDPLEYFFHSMSGRKGVSDTAMSTATSGYNMRRIVKLTEDITIHYDGTVRDNLKRQYQFAYNDLGYDSTKLFEGNICCVKDILNDIIENHRK